MSKTRFALSFTAGGLLYNESIVVAEALFRNERDWNLTLIEVEEKNLLQSRTPSTAKRKLREISQRLKCLTSIMRIQMEHGSLVGSAPESRTC
jgi:hypothetical protein